MFWGLYFNSLYPIQGHFNQWPLLLKLSTIAVLAMVSFWVFPESQCGMVDQGFWNQTVLNSNTASETSMHLPRLHGITILTCEMGTTTYNTMLWEFKWNNILNYWYIVGTLPIPVPWSSPLTLSFLRPGCPSTQNAKSKMLTTGRRSKGSKELFNSISAVVLCSNTETHKLTYLLKKFLANIWRFGAQPS